jgi:acetate kinase
LGPPTPQAGDVGFNETAEPDAELSAAGASVRTFVVEAREDLEIALGVRRAITAK